MRELAQVVAIDVIPYFVVQSTQYYVTNIDRDLQKAFTAFNSTDRKTAIATVYFLRLAKVYYLIGLLCLAFQDFIDDFDCFH